MSERRITPRESRFTARLHAEHYAAAFSARYQAMRNMQLIHARVGDPRTRAARIEDAKYFHREFLRCLREARQEAKQEAA